MTNNKYIVKNCPAYYYDEEYNDHLCKQPLIPYECNVDDCQDCTDCVIKQVIDKLREADNSCNGLNCTECSGFYMCHSQLANKIL